MAQLFLAALFGAGLLLIADTLARIVVRPCEVPAPLLVAIDGAPLLVWAARSLSTLDGDR